MHFLNNQFLKGRLETIGRSVQRLMKEMNGIKFPDHQTMPQEQVPLNSPSDVVESPSLDVPKMDRVLDNLIWAPFPHNRLKELVFSGSFQPGLFHDSRESCGKCKTYLYSFFPPYLKQTHCYICIWNFQLCFYIYHSCTCQGTLYIHWYLLIKIKKRTFLSTKIYGINGNFLLVFTNCTQHKRQGLG